MAALEVLRAAQLGFVSPAAGGALRYTPGQQVYVSWHTPWAFTNLEVFQGPREDGTFAVNVLGARLPQSETTYLWNSSSLLGSELSAPFYFRLQKSDLPNDCDTCAANSPSFAVLESNSATSTSTSTAAASTSTMEASPTSAAPAATTTAPDVAAAASSYIAAQTAKTYDGLSTGAKLGIGLGVGLGSALLAALLVTAVFFMRRRKRRFSEQEPTFDAVDREKELSLAQSQMQEPVPVHSRPQTEYSFLTKSSGKTKSYHGPFEFEDEQNGTPRPGSERLFTHPVTPERMPSILKRFRS
ncbi:hypothetical protein AC578_9490 [Pseudocercospora eumusae]|uniref:Uncharacterized protein n=1 Tax=Pseudocercospora eumusae TaxID=321146 RepID=A0A139GW62_9PEZI|nr:hypothetical protein AC578_9490 [Pseudocercospora eumusae]